MATEKNTRVTLPKILLTSIPRESTIRFRVFIWLAASFLWLIHSIGSAYYAFRGDPWSHGDWLISYTDGFVRRGLLGELIFGLAGTIDIHPGAIVLGLQTLAAAVFYFGLAALLLKGNQKLGIWLISLVPLGFAYVLVDPASAGRKEILLFAWAILWQRLESKNSKLRLAHAVASTCLVALVFSHEGFLFYIPLVLLISILSNTSLDWLDFFKRAGLLLVPSALAGSVIALVKTNATPAGLCAPILSAGYSEYTCDGAVYLAAEGGPSGISYGLSWLANFPTNYFIYFLFVVPFLGIIVAFLFSSLQLRRSKFGNRELGMLSIFALIASTPILIIAVDWGRYLQIAITLFAIAVVSHATGTVSLKPMGSPRLRFWVYLVLGLSIALFLLSGLSVSDGQYRSVVLNLLNIGYYLNGGLTPGVLR